MDTHYLVTYCICYTTASFCGMVHSGLRRHRLWPASHYATPNSVDCSTFHGTHRLHMPTNFPIRLVSLLAVGQDYEAWKQSCNPHASIDLGINFRVTTKQTATKQNKEHQQCKIRSECLDYYAMHCLEGTQVAYAMVTSSTTQIHHLRDVYFSVAFCALCLVSLACVFTYRCQITTSGLVCQEICPQCYQNITLPTMTWCWHHKKANIHLLYSWVQDGNMWYNKSL